MSRAVIAAPISRVDVVTVLASAHHRLDKTTTRAQYAPLRDSYTILIPGRGISSFLLHLRGSGHLGRLRAGPGEPRQKSGKALLAGAFELAGARFPFPVGVCQLLLFCLYREPYRSSSRSRLQLGVDVEEGVCAFAASPVGKASARDAIRIDVTLWGVAYLAPTLLGMARR